ncbi:MAG: hypothetical protein HY040_07495 [Planctomycetes bacterium]|nr:hypothetical protein [Planctomycetota bacterium]
MDSYWLLFGGIFVVWFMLAWRMDRDGDKLRDARQRRVACGAEEIVTMYAPQLKGEERAKAVEMIREALTAGMKRLFLPWGDRGVEMNFNYMTETAAHLQDMQDVATGTPGPLFDVNSREEVRPSRN